MIIVTGGAGFIGSNIVKGLNLRGHSDVLVVDHLGTKDKYKNIQSLDIMDYMDKTEFMDALLAGKFDREKIDVVFHEGACSDTMNYDGGYMLANNFTYSKNLLAFTARRRIQMMYASSASTYGSGKHGFREDRACEEALNVYAFSKLLFDNYVRRVLAADSSVPVVGLRYFNVYGPQENHKGPMASMIYQMFNQYKREGRVTLFGAYDGYEAGMQLRDFIYVKDVVRVNFYFWDHPQIHGIFNCGTGEAHPFKTLALGVLRHFGAPESKLEYVPFPEKLKGKYQSYTQSDASLLRTVGYGEEFWDIDKAIDEYTDLLEQHDGRFPRNHE